MAGDPSSVLSPPVINKFHICVCVKVGKIIKLSLNTFILGSCDLRIVSGLKITYSKHWCLTVSPQTSTHSSMLTLSFSRISVPEAEDSRRSPKSKPSSSFLNKDRNPNIICFWVRKIIYSQRLSTDYSEHFQQRKNSKNINLLTL